MKTPRRPTDAEWQEIKRLLVELNKRGWIQGSAAYDDTRTVRFRWTHAGRRQRDYFLALRDVLQPSGGITWDAFGKVADSTFLF